MGSVIRLASKACLSVVLTSAPVLAQTYQVRDSSGVEIIESGPAASRAVSPLALSAEPVLTIGSIDGAEPYLFSHIWDAARAPDGRVVVVEAMAYEIRVFDRDGRHLVTFGRRGGGPEEFGGPPWIELVRPDTLLVWDPGHYRLSRYSLTGDLLDQVTIRDQVVEYGITPFPNGRVWATSPVGRLLWMGPARVRPQEGLNDQYRSLIRIALDSPAVDLGRRISGQAYWLESPDGGFRGLPNSFGPATFAELGLAGEIWISDPQRYEILAYTAGGRLSRVLRGLIPRLPVGDDLVETARGQLPEMAIGLGIPLRRLERAFDEIPVPDSLPAIGALKRGGDGRLWVGRRMGVVWTRKPVGVFDVFAPTGEWQGSVHLPPDVFQLLYADESHVIVAAMDEFDVQYVGVYEIVETR
jgi:hypothetical protein